jgi:stage V sporulation protein G
MKITSSKVTRVDSPFLKAFVSLTLDECFLIRGFRVVEVSGRPSVQMPITSGSHSHPFEYVIPASPEMRERIESAILKIYFEAEEAESATALVPLTPKLPTLSAAKALPLPLQTCTDGTFGAVGAKARAVPHELGAIVLATCTDEPL